jgi:exodeoxyribonuclease VII large subunit
MMKQPSLFASPNWTVTSITAYLRELFESDELLRDVWVRGEISNLSRPRSGHIYFTLKDSGAAVKAVMWRSSVARLALDLRDGMEIETHGYISIYDVSGQYQLYADQIRPVGEGVLYQEYLRLKALLEAEGLFDPDAKRPIPNLPKKIGIVTSATGAALRDMLNTLQRRMPLAEVILAPTMVQGDAAPPKIVAAMDDLLRVAPDLDLLLLGRGGGSIEDLWAFNDERVVRAVAAYPVPVISGVGHETDFTLTDFASDLRAATPTAAAELATPITIAELLGANSYYADKLNEQMVNILDQNFINVDDAVQRLNYVSPLRRIQRDAQTLDGLSQRLGRGQAHRLGLLREKLFGLGSRLDALNPAKVLARGYAIVTRQRDGQVVGSTGDVQKDDKIQIRVKDGEIDAKII